MKKLQENKLVVFLQKTFTQADNAIQKLSSEGMQKM